jgi:hypothetical protein
VDAVVTAVHVKAAGSIPFMTFTYGGAKRVVLNGVIKTTATGDVTITGFETRRGKEKTNVVKAYRADRIGAA